MENKTVLKVACQLIGILDMFLNSHIVTLIILGGLQNIKDITLEKFRFVMNT